MVILGVLYLTLKVPITTAADGTLYFYFYLSKEIRLDVSCESSAKVSSAAIFVWRFKG